jgi:hypothetical protein
MKEGFYKNYPEEFYLINDLVPHIYKDINLDPRKADIFITTFDYLNRCVNYYALIPERKQFDKKLSTNIRKYLMNTKHIKSWNSYLDKYFKHERFGDTKEFFKKNLRNCEDHELHYHFAKLYHFFPINSQKYIEGVLKKVLSEKNEFGYVEIEEARWPDIKLCLYDTNRKEIRIRWGGEEYNNPRINQLELTIVEELSKEKANISLDPELFWSYFLSAMVNDDFTGKKCVWPFKGTHNSHVVIPIFDGGLPYEHKGNILSFIDLRFKSKNGAKDYLNLDKNQQPIEEIRNKWGPHIAEIAFDARRYELISQNIKHAGDILKDLFWKVAFIQDWERIMVFSKSSDQEPQFCFKRFPGDQVGRLEYEKVWGICEKEEKCKGCEDLLNGLKKTLYKNEKVHKNGNNFIFFQKMDDFLDPKVLPSIEDADVTRYKNHILCFEFPQYTFFPTESNTEQDKKKAAIEKLGEHYINKLIPIFDRLLLKRKVLRHSVKSAVSAIMSRNMSHNIGSHVLARLSRAEDIEKILPVESATFNSYLKARMDFMADISTATPGATLTLGLYRDCTSFLKLSETDLQSQKKREGKDEEKEKFRRVQKVLLDRISGVDVIRCNKINFLVKKGNLPLSLSTDDVYFASPNGIMGIHALYIILENIIRNTSKHAGVSSLTISIKANENWTNKEHLKREYIELTIWDNAGNCVYKEAENEQEKKLAVIKALKKAIKKPLIDIAGKVRGENWGLKKMKVSAGYLRLVPPKDVDCQIEPPLLKPIKADNHGNEIEDDNEKGNLGYRLYLLRPKNVLIIGKMDNLDNKEKLSERGIEIKSLEEVEEKMKEEKAIRHQFLAYCSDEDIEESICQHQYSWPLRRICLDDELKAKLHNNPNEFVLTLWSKWLKEISKEATTGLELLVTLGRRQWETINNVSLLYTYDKLKSRNKRYILYDIKYTHMLPNSAKDDAKKIIKEAIYKNKLIFWEPLRAWSAVMPYMEFPPSDENMKKILALRLMEAGLVSVAILDERIQEESVHDLKGSDFDANQVLQWMKVKMPKKGVLDLDEPNLDKKELQKWIRNKCKGIFFLVMHQGILDKIGLQEQEASEEWIEEIKKNNRIKQVIITSGRGTPFNIPQNTRFIKFSELQRWTVETRSKFHLVQSLCSARKAKYD